MTDGLVRQRRNLMLVCVLLWLLRYGGMTFTKVSLAGFDMVFKRPEAFLTTLWIAFFYFLYRYYQYFSAEAPTQLHSIFEQLRDEKCWPIIRSLVEAEYPANKATHYSYSTLKEWQWVFHGQLQTSGSNGVSCTNFQLPINKWCLTKGIIFACVDMLIRKHEVTDYLLPFLLAFFVIWYCGQYSWEGSFLRIMFL